MFVLINSFVYECNELRGFIDKVYNYVRGIGIIKM